MKDVEIVGPEEIELDFILNGAPAGSGSSGPSIDVQVIQIDGDDDQLDLSLVKIPKKKEEREAVDLYIQDDDDSKPHSERYMDSYEEGVDYEALYSDDIHEKMRYKIVLKNRDSSQNAVATIKLTITETSETGKTGWFGGHPNEIAPKTFDEITRIKPKVPGLKESSFIQGSRAVMEAFKVASLLPFIPKSQTTYQGNFATGKNSKDTFVPALDFTIDEETA